MKAIAPNGSPIIGTADLVPGNALIAGCSWFQDEDGNLAFEWKGETEMCWDGQYTRTDERGKTVYVAEDGTEWPEDQIKLVD